MVYFLSLIISGSSETAFILANGKEWVFGVVRQVGADGQHKEWECLHTAELTFEGKHITLMTALYMWVSSCTQPFRIEL